MTYRYPGFALKEREGLISLGRKEKDIGIMVYLNIECRWKRITSFFITKINV